MIGTRTPFRISFVGGGTDLKSFYSRRPGFVVSTTINKYMYIFIHPFFDQKIQVKYSRTELVEHIEEIAHPVVREVLKKFNISGVDINSIADIPAGTGLGSSCAFTVGLFNALYAYVGQKIDKEGLAQRACDLEINVLKEPIGKQDQYATAYGGLNFITFLPDDRVIVEPVKMSPERLAQLEKNLILFYLGGPRAARDILTYQVENLERDERKFTALEKMANIALKFKTCLENGSLDDVGVWLEENWQLKKTLSPLISNEKIDHYYQAAKRNGALGGKLLGAGGGGFLLFYCPEEHQEKLKLSLADLRPMKVRFDKLGSQIIFDDRKEKE